MWCDDCLNLDPKEKDQTKDKEPHMCRFFNVFMYHNGNHPHIESPDDCMGYEKETKRTE